MDDIDYNETGGDAWWYWADERPRRRKKAEEDRYHTIRCGSEQEIIDWKNAYLLLLTIIGSLIIAVPATLIIAVAFDFVSLKEIIICFICCIPVGCIIAYFDTRRFIKKYVTFYINDKPYLGDRL